MDDAKRKQTSLKRTPPICGAMLKKLYHVTCYYIAAGAVINEGADPWYACIDIGYWVDPGDHLGRGR